jgi:serine/threonine protein kinase
MSEQSSVPDWKSLLQLLEGCLAFSSSSRFTAKQALQHAFFRESG